ncbi:Uncharacterised protein [Bordetella pertussis]|nr:Uncharacterised protein [Bordetella pertussis]
MTESGFSWPSMIPCCKAVATSGQAIGVGRIPIWRNAVMWMGFSVVRIFRPLASAGVLTGRTLLVRWRKPCSPQARAMMPRSGNFASISWPILLSSTARACGRSRSRNGMSNTPVSGTKLSVAPVETMARSMVPICRPSITSRSPPRALLANCCTLYLPPEAPSMDLAKASAPAP